MRFRRIAHPRAPGNLERHPHEPALIPFHPRTRAPPDFPEVRPTPQETAPWRKENGDPTFKDEDGDGETRESKRQPLGIIMGGPSAGPPERPLGAFPRRTLAVMVSEQPKNRHLIHEADPRIHQATDQEPAWPRQHAFGGLRPARRFALHLRAPDAGGPHPESRTHHDPDPALRRPRRPCGRATLSPSMMASGKYFLPTGLRPPLIHCWKWATAGFNG